jgi:predicted regulator of Ras-like GTPase activity (Roadblock/LC7/MglB family)
MLEPLATLPGVQVAMLVSEDGVPIVIRGETRQEDGKEKENVDDAEVLAALTAGWIADVCRAIAPISWSPPRRLVLRASRGTLIAMQAPRALLVVVIGRGVQAGELRLPMESAIARMERELRGGNRRASGQTPVQAEESAQPVGIFPTRHTTPAAPPAAVPVERAKNKNSEPYGPSGN